MSTGVKVNKLLDAICACEAEVLPPAKTGMDQIRLQRPIIDESGRLVGVVDLTLIGVTHLSGAEQEERLAQFEALSDLVTGRADAMVAGSVVFGYIPRPKPQRHYGPGKSRAHIRGLIKPR